MHRGAKNDALRIQCKPIADSRVPCTRQGMFTMFNLEHLVPLLIWIFTSCPFFNIWEVLLANIRCFMTSWGTCVFVGHAYIIFSIQMECVTHVHVFLDVDTVV